MTAQTIHWREEGPGLLAGRVSLVAGVLALHAALGLWVMNAQVSAVSWPAPRPIRLDVRMIEVVPPRPAALVLPERVKGAPKPVALNRPVIQRAAQPVPSPPVLAVAPRAEPAPTTFPVSTQAPAPLTKAVEPPVAVAAPGPAPVSALVTAARFDADYLRNPAPTYPAMSRKLHEEGRVLLQVTVTAAGMAEQVQIKQGSGYPRLDEAALNTVRQWRFTPARRGDEAVAASVVVPIVFRLDE